MTATANAVPTCCSERGRCSKSPLPRIGDMTKHARTVLRHVPDMTADITPAVIDDRIRAREFQPAHVTRLADRTGRTRSRHAAHGLIPPVVRPIGAREDVLRYCRPNGLS